MEVKLPTRPFNPQSLDAEMSAALGATYEGWRSEGDSDVYLIFNDAITPAEVQIAKETYQAHDPSVLTDAQKLENKRDNAVTAISGANFKAVRTSIENATSLAQLKPILLEMLELQYYTALAVRLTNEDIGA